MKIKIGFKSDKALLNSLLITKIFYIFFAELIYSRLTRLGDTPKYLSSSFKFNFSSLLSSTDLMKVSGSLLGHLPFPFYHLPLCFLSWVGLKFLYERMIFSGVIKNSYNDRVLFFLIFSLPSIGVWTSIHSKEAVGVFFTSILSGFLCSFVVSKKLFINKRSISVLFLSLYLMLIFKVQYFIGFFSIFSFVYFRNKFNLRPSVLLLVLIFMVVLQVVVLYVFQPIVDYYSFQMHAHFDSDVAKSTRPNIFLSEGDFYRNAFSGMIIAFVGPTITESVSSFAKMFAFIESIILCTLFSPVIYKVFKGRLNITHVAIVIFLVGWLLFMHYPFGIFNPGSALRYRNNFIPFICISLFVIKNWRSSISR